MADRQKQLQSAEGLLKQGKVQAALHQLNRLADGASGDLLTLNRIGDLLARQKHAKEAIQYYTRIATQFTEQGFYPKAVAIHKKILRLEPRNPGSLLKLGELYLQQKLPGEARNYLLSAAERQLEAQDFASARQTYERLVEAHPQDLRHRARLAEARALEGDVAGAAEELVDLGRCLLERGETEDAERSFRRAAELAPEGATPRLGIADCLSSAGKEAEALAFLEEGTGRDDPLIVGEIALRHARAGREDRALEGLRGLDPASVPSGTLHQWFSWRIESGDVEALWKRMTPVFEAWAASDLTRTGLLLSELGRLEEHGHVPALQRLFELLKKHDDRGGMTQALERLVQAYEARSMDTEASSMREQLKALAPKSPLVEQIPGAAEEPAPVAAVSVAEDEADPADLEAEAPAVPLNRADEEYVTGRLTQAEILEKYGLRGQALDQVREVTGKFPGHVSGMQRLVELLRGGPDRTAFREALIGLALAQRASGELDQARKAAGEALLIGGVPAATKQRLERLALIAAPGKQAPAGAPAVSPSPTPPAKPPAPPAAPPARDREVLVIDLDAMDEDTDQGADVPAVAAAAEPEEASEAETAVSEAEAQQVMALLPDEEAAEERETAALEDDDDLSAITSALETELFADEEDGPVPGGGAGGEQSLSEVFAAFRQHVEEQVESDDFRTHYDLGIAYKEMGLSEEAIHEFEVAVQSAELKREASIMLGICHRERDELVPAIDWYRRALEITAPEGESNGLRYDLAELLLQTGDRDGALDLFRGVLASEPSFRDIQDRVAELEAPSVSD